MAVYVRTSGGYVAERIQPAPGSADEARLKQLAAEHVDGWQLAEDDKPKRTNSTSTRSGAK